MHFRKQLCSWVGFFQFQGRGKCMIAVEGENKNAKKLKKTDYFHSDMEGKIFTS